MKLVNGQWVTETDEELKAKEKCKRDVEKYQAMLKKTGGKFIDIDGRWHTLDGKFCKAPRIKSDGVQGWQILLAAVGTFAFFFLVVIFS